MSTTPPELQKQSIALLQPTTPIFEAPMDVLGGIYNIHKAYYYVLDLLGIFVQIH